MTDAARRTKGTQSGPRSAEIVSRIFAAASSELHRVGYARLTMDGVARVAGVNRTTLYRRWPSKAELVTALMEPSLDSYRLLPFVGDPEADALALMKQLRDNAMLPVGRTILAAFGSGETELAEVVSPLTARIRAAFRRVLASVPGAQDGELDAAAHLLFYGVAAWPESHGTAPDDDDLRVMLGLVLRSLGESPERSNP